MPGGTVRTLRSQRLRVLLLGLAILSGSATLVSLFLLPPEYRTSLLRDTTIGWFGYYPEVRISMEGPAGNRPLIVEIHDEERYTGFGVQTSVSVSPHASLRVTLKSDQRTSLQIDLREGEPYGESGRVFYADAFLPDREWTTFEIPVSKFVWNSNAGEHTDPGERGMRIDTTRINSAAFTFSPGTSTRLEVIAVELVDPSAKAYILLALLAVGFFCLGGSFALAAKDRSQVEASLADSESRYEAIFNTVSEGILVLEDQTGALLAANPTARGLLESLSPNMDWENDSLRNLACEILTHRNGDFAWESGSPDPALRLEVSVRSGRVASRQALLVVLEDVTAARKAADERRRLEQQLVRAQKLEAVGILAGGVAHDFNNLLTGITCSAELALDEVSRDPELAEALTNILELAGRGAGLTQQLLAFSRQQPICRSTFQAAELVQKTLRLLKRTLGEDIKVNFRSRAKRDQISGDQGQLEQVLVNLAINARDAMAGGGELRLETSNQKLEAGEDPRLKAGDYLVLSVRDTGPGIPEETLPHIFEPFFTTKGPGRGTGLGLAMAYGIIRQHQGEIEVYSAPGKGTCFTIRLPLTDDELESEEPPREESPIEGGTETVLVVEDEPGVRSLVVRVLRTLGYEVLVARSPEDAFPLYVAHKDEVDLLVSDVVMPGESGPAFYQRLRAVRADLPVLFMSGHSADLTLSQRFPFLRKPFGPRDLGRKVRDVLDQTQESRVAAARL